MNKYRPEFYYEDDYDCPNKKERTIDIKTYAQFYIDGKRIGEVQINVDNDNIISIFEN
jgi:hypothetical protein